MICPNDGVEMRRVQTQSHVGQRLVLDQCGKCGGIWFDRSELYRAKQGEAEKIELLDPATLTAPTEIESPSLRCPRDEQALVRFSDRYFPQDIIVARCPACDGFWLNRGEFAKFQRAREAIRSAQGSREDQRLPERVEEILAPSRAANSSDVLGRLARFLSTPLDQQTLLPLDADHLSPEEENALGTIVNALTSVLSIFVVR